MVNILEVVLANKSIYWGKKKEEEKRNRLLYTVPTRVITKIS